MRYILNEETVDKFCEYGRNVWDIEEEDAYKCANLAIDATEQFFKECGIPMTLKEVGIDESKLEIMAEDTIKYNAMDRAYVALDKNDVLEILKACL